MTYRLRGTKNTGLTSRDMVLLDGEIDVIVSTTVLQNRTADPVNEMIVTKSVMKKVSINAVDLHQAAWIVSGCRLQPRDQPRACNPGLGGCVA